MNPEKPNDFQDGAKRTKCPWRPARLHAHQHPRGRPPRHWFFMKILFFFFWVCVILTISFFAFGGLTSHKVFHAFLVVFLVMLLGSMMLRRIFRPLRWLMQGVHEISNGNLDFQFPTKGRRGEIWYLAEQFNQMVGHVKEMIHSKDQLLLDVSHELRSPLTRMRVALEMAPKGKWKESMTQDIGEMEAMLAELLETERLKGQNGKISPEELDLAAVVEEVLGKFAAREPGVTLVGNPGKLWIQADRARVKTVLQNVLENALKYSAHQKKPVEISLQKGTEGVSLAIQDFGGGIPSRELENVFEPFYRVDKSRAKETGGYGLGLSLCREIMRAHGGDISLEGLPNEGTCANLWFPVEPVHRTPPKKA